MMKWLKIGIPIAALVAAFFFGVTVRGWRDGAKADAQHRAQLIAQAKADQATAKSNAATAARDAAALTQIQSLQSANAQLKLEIANANLLAKPVISPTHGTAISACPVLGADFLRLYNAASSDSAASPRQASTVHGHSTNRSHATSH